MQVSSNKLGELRKFFHKELSEIYEEGEINALFMLAAETFLGWTRDRITRGNDERLNQSDLLKLYDCAKDLAHHRPLQYILGETWFMDLRFKVNKSVLIPRPETEELVRRALSTLGPEPITAIDIGTGSGCISVTLKKHRPQWQVLACDISADALQVAAENAQLHSVDLGLFRCDVLHEPIGGSFDLVISNPPYIKASEKDQMAANVLQYEPHLALFTSGNDPILFYRKIIDLCQNHLADHGHLLFELNPLTATEVLEIAEKSKLFKDLKLIRDISGKERILHGVKK